MKLNSQELNLLKELAEQIVDISKLQEKFGSNIQNVIKKLIDLEIPIEQLNLNQYTLKIPFQTLEVQKISQELNIPIQHCFYYDLLDSTQSYMKNNRISSPAICISQMQTKGKGRQNKQWHSPFGLNIYFSYQNQLFCPISNCQGLSLVVGLACLKSLSTLYPKLSNDLKIKWPNDIWLNNKKLAGILIDILKTSEDSIEILIGIGMNINTLPEHLNQIPQPATSLRIANQKVIQIEEVLTHLISQINIYLNHLEKNGLHFFLNEWTSKDMLFQKEIKIKQHEKIISGKGLGITNNGLLKILTKNGKTIEIDHGEASIII